MEVKIRSVVPIYLAAGVWLLYALCFPLYRLWHFLPPLCLSAAAWYLGGKLFKPTVTHVEVPEPPVSYGPEIDAILAENQRCQAELTRLEGSIAVQPVKEKIARLRDLTDKIARDLVDDPGDLSQVRRFFAYYPPTVLKLLNAYDRADAQGIEGSHIAGVKRSIEDMLDTAVDAYEKQLDALFADQALDIETDIAVLNMKLSAQGLGPGDFKL